MQYVNVVIAAAFFAAGVVNLTGPPAIRAEFAKWGYPAWLRVAVASAELGGSVLLLMPRAQGLGASVLVVITLGILVSFFRSREWMRMQYPLVLLLLLVAILQQAHVSTRVLAG